MLFNVRDSLAPFQKPICFMSIILLPNATAVLCLAEHVMEHQQENKAFDAKLTSRGSASPLMTHPQSWAGSTLRLDLSNEE
jgi:hypothetical protein